MSRIPVFGSPRGNEIPIPRPLTPAPNIHWKKGQPQEKAQQLPPISEKQSQETDAALCHGTLASPLPSSSAVLKNPRVEQLKKSEGSLPPRVEPLKKSEDSLPRLRGQKPHGRTLELIVQKLAESKNQPVSEAWTCTTSPNPPRDHPETRENNGCAVGQPPMDSRASTETTTGDGDASAQPTNQSNTRSAKPQPQPQAQFVSKLLTPAITLPRSLPHRCKFCRKKFKTADDLSAHVAKDHPTKSSNPVPANTSEKQQAFEFGCPFCKFSNSAKAVSDRHVLEFHHVESPTLYCDDCGRGFFVDSMLQEHKKVHLANSDSIGSTDEATKASNVRKVQPVGSGTKNVPKSTAIAESTKTQTTHNEVNDSNSSSGGQGARDDARSLPRGKDTSGIVEETEDGKMWKVGKTKYQILDNYESPRGVKANFFVASPAEPLSKSFKHPRRKCSICPKTVTTSYYKTHKRMHSGQRGDPVPCPECDRLFPTKTHLKTHIERVHEFKINHTCTVCNQGFYRLQEQQKHISIEHDKVRFVCVECLKDFKYKDGLRAHNRSVHSPAPTIQVITNSPFQNPPPPKQAAASSARNLARDFDSSASVSSSNASKPTDVDRGVTTNAPDNSGSVPASSAITSTASRPTLFGHENINLFESTPVANLPREAAPRGGVVFATLADTSDEDSSNSSAYFEIGTKNATSAKLASSSSVCAAAKLDENPSSSSTASRPTLFGHENINLFESTPVSNLPKEATPRGGVVFATVADTSDEDSSNSSDSSLSYFEIGTKKSNSEKPASSSSAAAISNEDPSSAAGKSDENPTKNAATTRVDLFAKQTQMPASSFGFFSTPVHAAKESWSTSVPYATFGTTKTTRAEPFNTQTQMPASSFGFFGTSAHTAKESSSTIAAAVPYATFGTTKRTEPFNTQTQMPKTAFSFGSPVAPPTTEPLSTQSKSRSQVAQPSEPVKAQSSTPAWTRFGSQPQQSSSAAIESQQATSSHSNLPRNTGRFGWAQGQPQSPAVTGTNKPAEFGFARSLQPVASVQAVPLRKSRRIIDSFNTEPPVTQVHVGFRLNSANGEGPDKSQRPQAEVSHQPGARNHPAHSFGFGFSSAGNTPRPNPNPNGRHMRIPAPDTQEQPKTRTHTAQSFGFGLSSTGNTPRPNTNRGLRSDAPVTVIQQPAMHTSKFGWFGQKQNPGNEDAPATNTRHMESRMNNTELSFAERTQSKSFSGARRRCSDCGKEYAASYVNTHKLKAHPKQSSSAAASKANLKANPQQPVTASSAIPQPSTSTKASKVNPNTKVLQQNSSIASKVNDTQVNNTSTRFTRSRIIKPSAK